MKLIKSFWVNNIKTLNAFLDLLKEDYRWKDGNPANEPGCVAPPVAIHATDDGVLAWGLYSVYDNTEKKAEYIHKLDMDARQYIWDTFGEVAVDNKDNILSDFLDFKAGTSRFEVLKWFEDELRISVPYLLYGPGKDEGWKCDLDGNPSPLDEEMIDMSIYASSIPGMYSEKEIEEDNLIEIRLPKCLVAGYFMDNILDSFKGDDPSASNTALFEEWLDEYTADSTQDLWEYANGNGFTVKRFPGCTYFRDAIKESDFTPGTYDIGFCREEDGNIIGDETEFSAENDVSELWFLFKAFCEENDFPWFYNILYVTRVGGLEV